MKKKFNMKNDKILLWVRIIFKICFCKKELIHYQEHFIDNQ